MVDIQYYTFDHGKLKDNQHVYLTPGDMYKICNALHDYCSVLEEARTGAEHSGYENITVEDYIKRLKKVQHKLEKALDYDVAKAIEKCEKKKPKKENDIGEDALVLSFTRTQKKEKPEEKKEEKQ